jgi:hypothetical protein
MFDGYYFRQFNECSVDDSEVLVHCHRILDLLLATPLNSPEHISQGGASVYESEDDDDQMVSDTDEEEGTGESGGNRYSVSGASSDLDSDERYDFIRINKSVAKAVQSRIIQRLLQVWMNFLQSGGKAGVVDTVESCKEDESSDLTTKSIRRFCQCIVVFVGVSSADGNHRLASSFRTKKQYLEVISLMAAVVAQCNKECVAMRGLLTSAAKGASRKRRQDFRDSRRKRCSKISRRRSESSSNDDADEAGNTYGANYVEDVDVKFSDDELQNVNCKICPVLSAIFGLYYEAVVAGTTASDMLIVTFKRSIAEFKLMLSKYSETNTQTLRSLSDGIDRLQFGLESLLSMINHVGVDDEMVPLNWCPAAVRPLARIIRSVGQGVCDQLLSLNDLKLTVADDMPFTGTVTACNH